MSCKVANFGGWGECAALLEDMNGAALVKKGGTKTDTTILSSVGWHADVAALVDADRNTLILPILSFENTTDDVEIITSPLGKKSMGKKPIPSGIVYLDASICDYKHLHDLEDIWFEFVPFFQGNSLWQTRNSDTTLKGFRCKLGTKAGLPPEDKNQSFPMYIFFDRYSEFEDVVVVTPEFTFGDILDFSAVAIDVVPTSVYAAGDVTVKVTSRGTGAPVTDLVLADFNVLGSNGTPVVSVTAIDAAGAAIGVYVLTVMQDTDAVAAVLTSGQYAIIQAQKDDATYVTHLSNIVKISV